MESIKILNPLGVPLHPSRLYEIIYLAVIFGVVLGLKSRLKPDGSLFLVYLGLYSVWRLGTDFIRQGTPFLFGLHQAPVVAIIVLAIIIPWLALQTRRVKTDRAI